VLACSRITDRHMESMSENGPVTEPVDVENLEDALPHIVPTGAGQCNDNVRLIHGV
jgi:hypothetical protein